MQKEVKSSEKTSREQEKKKLENCALAETNPKGVSN